MPKSSLAVTKLEKAIANYIENVAAIGRTQSTIQRYNETLMEFYEFFSNEDSEWRFHDPTFTTMQAWRNELVAKGLKANTVKQKCVHMNMFFGYSSREGGPQFYEKNPVSPRIYPDTKYLQRPYETILTNEQIALLWKYDFPVQAKRYYWNRNYAIVVLLITSMMRNAELRAITPNDLDWENEEIEVEHGKGDKYRRVPFPKIAQQAVKLYLLSRVRPAEYSESDPLFYSSRGGDNKDWLSRAVMSHVRLVTGVDGVRSHDLRHIGAYLGLNSGKTLEELQAELGHAKPEMTQLYSGRLTARKNRRGVKTVFEEMEYQIKRNEVFLEEKSPI